ncbi:MAG: hypothetical protein DSO07_12000 [Thermoproteota archaeon]|jgi:hypothetical protein|nr:MAG: hypothetical protein DSO07_12000 [Candidatus Korarchaeota archaeon]
MKASEAYRRGLFNQCNQIWDLNGKGEFLIYKYGWKRAYRFVVKYKPGMEPKPPSSLSFAERRGKGYTFDDLFDVLEDEDVDEVIE